MSFNIYPDWTKRNGIYPQWLGPDEVTPVEEEDQPKILGGGGSGFQQTHRIQGTRSYPDTGRVDQKKRKQRRQNMAVIEFICKFTTEHL